MKITSHQLEAFFETARFRSFSKAADSLGVTQSALSQRVSNLEKDLEVTLFIRDTAGPKLTAAAERLLRFAQMNQSLEQEVLSELQSSSDQLAGEVRVAGYSSVMRSVIIPSLAPLLRNHPKIHCEFRSFEVVDLPDVLRSAEADYVILDYHINKKGIVEHVLGREEFVVIEGTKFSGPDDVYLDHGPHDNATEAFFLDQSNGPKTYRRSFMGDVYGIIDGVEGGIGRAVMSKHLIVENKLFRVVKGYKRYFRDVTLHYFDQPFFSRLHKEIVRLLISNSVKYL